MRTEPSIVLLATLLASGVGRALPAQTTPRLLGDLAPGAPDLTPDSDPRGFVEINGRVLFHAESARFGRELYVHDGQGTRLLRDFGPGPFSAMGDDAQLVRLGNHVLFAVASQTDGGIYRTDGTAAGTRRIRYLANAAFGWQHTYSDGNRVWFRSYEPGFGIELFVTDGTNTGTHRVADINPGRGSSADPYNSHFGSLASYQGLTWFSADDGVHGYELWVTDGTAAGTRLFLDIVPGPEGSNPQALQVLNGKLLFVAAVNSTPGEWWSTDGTLAGTGQVSGWHVSRVDPGYTVQLGNQIVFRVQSPLHGNELFVTDGTGPGTQVLKDIIPGITSNFGSPMVAWNNAVWFVTNDGVHGSELWRTDGSTAGTQLAVEMIPGASGGFRSGFGVLPGGLVFAGRDNTADGFEPWFTDGTQAGTRQLADIQAGTTGSLTFERDFTSIGNEVWFPAWTFDSGEEPWRTDGTPAGTRAVAELGRETIDSDPWTPGFDAGLRLVFQSTGPAIGSHASWRTDGTPQGTARWSGALGSIDHPQVFHLPDGDLNWWNDGRRLTSSDLSGDTIRIRESGPISSDLTAMGGEVFYRRDEVLRAIDPATGSTREVFSLGTSPFAVGPTRLTTAGNLLWFFATEGSVALRYGLWVSDGTTAGTRVAFPVPFQHNTNTDFHQILPLGNRALVRVPGNAFGELRLWISDGTTHTQLAQFLQPFETGPMVASPRQGEALFAARDANHGSELWVTDGTPTGTHLLLDIKPGPQSSEPLELTRAGDLVFFSAEDGQRGRELWVTDGTVAGTRLAADAVPGFDGVRPMHLLALGDASAVAFQGHDAFGRELWSSDGTPAGTARLTDIQPGSATSDPIPLGVTGTALVFSAYDDLHGVEPWAIDLEATPGFVARLLGAGCAGSNGTAPRASTLGALRVGATGFALRLTAARPQTSAGVLLDFAPHPVALGACTLWLLGAPIALPAATDALGDSHLPVPVPADPALAGAELFAQWLVTDPGGALGGALSASGLTRLVIGR